MATRAEPRLPAFARGLRTPAQWFCLIGGVFFLVRGVGGFFVHDPSFDMPGEGWHNLFHLVSAAALLLAAGDAALARVGAIGFGVLYGAVAVIGIVDGSDVLGFIPVQTEAHIFHSLVAAASLLSGLISSAGPVAPGADRASPA